MAWGHRAVVGLLCCVLVAGCGSFGGAGTTGERSCSLHHELVPAENGTDNAEQTYEYGSLSEDARTVVDATRNSTGGYDRPANETAVPEEFEYTDEIASYELQMDNETYLLRTWTNAGCMVS